MNDSNSLAQEFIEFAVNNDVLRFGEFVTKAGRISPYFFNAGAFDNGASLGMLAQFYARSLLASGIEFDMLFGPAYKGITLASATAVALAGMNRNVPFAFNRKEAKDHGEGGNIVGASLQGRIVIVDDVISAGTSVRESVDLIRDAGAMPCAVLIALDRMERTGKDNALSTNSAVQEVSRTYGIPVVSIGRLTDLLAWLAGAEVSDAPSGHQQAITAYRQRYGVV